MSLLCQPSLFEFAVHVAKPGAASGDVAAVHVLVTRSAAPPPTVPASGYEVLHVNMHVNKILDTRL